MANFDCSIILQRLLYETLLWKSVSHKRLLPLLGVVDGPSGPGMVSPLCEHGHSINFLKTMMEKHEPFRWTQSYEAFINRWVGTSPSAPNARLNYL